MNTHHDHDASAALSSGATAEIPIIRATVCAGSLQTHYLRAGRGPPLVLLHRGGSGLEVWQPLFAPLSSQLRLIAPEVPAGGEQARWLGSFLDGLGLQSVSLLGDDEGAAVALRFALEEPERVEQLVLVGVDSRLDGSPRSSFRRQLRKIARPTLIARGAHDFSASTAVEAAVPVQVCVLPAAGSRPFEDQPLAFSAAVMQFLSSSSAEAVGAVA